jgi:ABC-type transport system involved in multi-copper enzyme maturation permease subunit
MRYDAGFRWGMGSPTLKIVFSLIGAGAISFCVFILLEALLSRPHAANAGAVLFRFQLSSMLAMGVFAGLAIVIFVRLSRSRQRLRK